MAVSSLRTTCHQPPDTNTVSPGPCSSSTCLYCWGRVDHLGVGHPESCDGHAALFTTVAALPFQQLLRALGGEQVPPLVICYERVPGADAKGVNVYASA